MMFDEFRPFFLGAPKDWGRYGIPAAWNGVGSQHHAWHMSDVRRHQAVMRECCEALACVSVRNRTTEKFVRRSGYSGAIHVIPDPAIFLQTPSRDIADAVLSRAGISSEALLVGLSVGNAFQDARAQWFFEDLVTTLKRLIMRDDALQLVIFPFGYVYGDAALQYVLHQRLPVAHRITETLTPLECWALVGRMNAYIGTRFHSIIAAFAAGVPFLALDEYFSCTTASSKIRDFVVENDLEQTYLNPFVDIGPGERVEALLQQAYLGARQFGPHLEVARDRLDRHYRHLLVTLGLMSSV